ncbi:MAG: stage V sporulation protein D [Ruminococcus sp.]|nr:PASTA domain-containing penicillin-binding protein [uncultured Ruminococcus sp.]MBQ1350261.1 stage V sporulation protein D [Ruminococcus sp.]MBQ4170311.1 stage V sporulation protein D [Ruminococcus sp.]SCX21643.1 stage V sporulation protein D (sporulation-specific penicillin-binding protein) [Ruminococcaceae bacterium P7]
MEEKKKQKLFDKKRADRGPNQRLRQRTAVLIILILVVGFGATLLRLSFLTMVQGSELQEKAVGQQLSDTVLTAKRGSIYDAKGTTLAESASVWQVVLAPINFDDDKQREAAARGLSEILGLDYENVLEKTQQKNYYTVVKRKIEVEQRDKVIELMKTLTKEYDCGSVIQLLDDYKRYYPKDTLASAVIGFTGADEQGLEGVEYKYDKYLSGTPGRIITAKNARGTNMPFQYEQNVESENGNNIYLTIDETIQSICEKYVAQAVIDNNVMNRAGCICMDVNTAAILAMVTSDGYNLNDPYQLPSSEVDRIKQLPKEEQDKEESKALAAMWRNKCVADTYMPGSVFKMCTASMALEEGKIKDNSSFTCGGYMRVEDYDIGCSVTSGHGTQTFLESFCHSCNPAFIQIGQLVGIDKFRDYYTAFGFSEKSGIDLPGEADDSFWPEGQMGMVDLAVASFGQNFSITPLSMITACAAVSNGGYVLQPYVVSKITDADGNVVKTMERKVKRQVISTETSERLCEMLAAYPEVNGAAGGAVPGYKVGGKTGTSEKIGIEKNVSSFGKDYIASFCGIAPTDDPQIALLVFLDTPSGGGYYGSQIAAPLFTEIMSEVLPYLEISTDYKEEDLAYLNVSAGDYTNISSEEAVTKVSNDGFIPEIVGSGTTVVSQMPTVSSKMAQGGTIVLYTDNTTQPEKVTVPDFKNAVAYEVNGIAAMNGLNVSYNGAVSASGVAVAQSVKEGTQVNKGTVIAVTFKANAEGGSSD